MTASYDALKKAYAGGIAPGESAFMDAFKHALSNKHRYLAGEFRDAVFYGFTFSVTATARVRYGSVDKAAFQAAKDSREREAQAYRLNQQLYDTAKARASISGGVEAESKFMSMAKPPRAPSLFGPSESDFVSYSSEFTILNETLRLESDVVVTNFAVPSTLLAKHKRKDQDILEGLKADYYAKIFGAFAKPCDDLLEKVTAPARLRMSERAMLEAERKATAVFKKRLKDYCHEDLSVTVVMDKNSRSPRKLEAKLFIADIEGSKGEPILMVFDATLPSEPLYRTHAVLATLVAMAKKLALAAVALVVLLSLAVYFLAPKSPDASPALLAAKKEAQPIELSPNAQVVPSADDRKADSIANETTDALAEQVAQDCGAPGSLTDPEPSSPSNLADSKAECQGAYATAELRGPESASQDFESAQSQNITTAPSFDCSAATSRTEIMICSDRSLSLSDQTMSKAYRNALLRVGDGPSLRRNQRDWIANVRGACEDVQCLVDAYSERISKLSGDELLE